MFRLSRYNALMVDGAPSVYGGVKEAEGASSRTSFLLLVVFEFVKLALILLPEVERRENLTEFVKA